MIFECFVEGKGIPFLAQGNCLKKASEKAKAFLDYWGLPTEGLCLKEFRRRSKRKAKNREVVLIK